MGQRRIGQGSLAEALLAASAGSNRRLERIAGLVDWAPIERLLLPLRAPTGRPGYPPLALCSARWCWRSGTSSPIPALRKRWRTGCLSVPSAASASTTARPTETTSARGQTTLCRFCAALADRGLAEALFAELNRPLDAKGLVLKAGTLIDATLVEAAVARPPQSEGEVSTKDPEAGFTRRGQRSFFGFKAQVAVDLGSDLTRNAVDLCHVTSARPSVSADSLAADGLLQGDDGAPREARFAGCHWLRCSWSRRQRPKGGTRPMTAPPDVRRWPKPGSPPASCIAVMRAARSPPGSAG